MRKLINNLEEGFISLLLVAMTLLVFAEVIARFVFSAGIHWAQEVTLLMAAWFVLFGASYGIKVGSHIGVDVFVKMLPKEATRFFTLLAIALCLFYCGLFLYGSWIYLGKMMKYGIELEDLPVPKWIPMSVLMIGFGLLVVRFLQLGWSVLNRQADGFHLADEAKESMELADELKDAVDQAADRHSADTDSKPGADDKGVK
ncbi:MAG: TRAP transporter small permease [Marinobacterium sp.]|nr:TRAP transporter small permease [Marinobacterium sp.]